MLLTYLRLKSLTPYGFVVQVSRIIQTLVKYRGLNIGMDEYGLGRRAGTLVERWGTPEH